MKNKSDFFKVNLIYFIVLVFLVGVRIIANMDLLSFMGEFGSYVLNLVLQVGFMFLLPLFLFSWFRKQKPKQTFKDFNFKKINIKAILICILIGVVVFLLNLVVSTIFNAIISAFGYDPTASSTSNMTSYPVWLFLLTILFSAVLPGICEEFTHRGMLLTGLRKLGVVKTIVISSLLFGLMHLNIEQFFYASLIGALLGFMTISTGSIIPAMIVHFMNNAISTYLSFASFNKLWLGGFYTRIAEMFQNGFAIALCLTFAILFVSSLSLVGLLYALFKETKIKRVKAITENIAKTELRNNLLDGIEPEEENKQEQSEIQYEKTVQITDDKHIVSLIVPADEFNFPLNQIEKPTFGEKIFFIANLTLGVVVTLCTYIWGII